MKNLLKNVLFGLFFVFASCSSDQDGDKVHDKKDKCPDTPKGVKVDASGCPVSNMKQVEQIGAINFYLENSASMAGYLKGNTEFKNIVTDLIVLLDGTDSKKGLNLNTIAEDITPYKGNPNKFRNELATVPLAREKSSEMHRMFRKMLDKADKNDISVFVSDCILSFPDEEIRKNRQVNVENAKSTLKSDIKSTFQRFQKDDIATSVYAFTSGFNGPYYTYENQKINLTNARRPFYVWVTGKKDILDNFNKTLQQQSSFRPDEQLHFGFESEPVDNHQILASIIPGRNYKVRTPFKDLTSLNIKPRYPVTFVAGLNLNQLPAFAREPNYLLQNLKLESGGTLKAKVIAVNTYDEVEGRIKNSKEKERSLQVGHTHFISIQLNDMVGEKTELNLILPKEVSDWYKNWSTMDDRQPNPKGTPRTFAFEHLIDGVKEAYKTAGGANLIDTKMTLSK